MNCVSKKAPHVPPRPRRPNKALRLWVNREEADAGTDKGFWSVFLVPSLKTPDTCSSDKTCKTQDTTSFCNRLGLYVTRLLFLAFMDSNILKTNSSYLYHLGKFLQSAVGYNSHWLLCWRATLHGWNVRTQFHRRCDGKRDTVTIIKKGKYVFGGYTDIPWGKKIACLV